MWVTFWGVRGSYPVPGPSTVRYGGQTSCVEVELRGGHRLILDAGTGLRSLGQKLARIAAASPRRHHHIVLSHVHWDHIQGLPFFEPAYIAGTRISVYALRAAAEEVKHVVCGITRHEFFPMPLEAVPARFEFLEVVPKRGFAIGEFSLMPVALNHPFGAVGYRVDGDGTSLAYICDTAPFGDVLHKQHFLSAPEELSEGDRAQLAAMRRDLVDVVSGTHTVIYDTHFLPEEYRRFPHYGHSTPEHALDLCTGIGVQRLVLFHHAPSRSDAEMDQVVEQYKLLGAERGIEVIAAVEGETLAVGGRRSRTKQGVTE